MIAIVRHGEREDDSTNKKRRSAIGYDPSLSEIGEQQARLTGRYILEKYLLKENSHMRDNLKIISSPFLRTLQTAAIIAREVNCQRIDVWDPICEELKEDIFAFFPLPHINFYVHNMEFISKHFLNSADVEIARMESQEEILMPYHYPETKENKNSRLPHIRAQLAFEYLIKTQFATETYLHGSNAEVAQSPNLENPNKLLLVTHAFALLPFVKYFTSQNSYVDRGYCALSVAQRDTLNSWKLIKPLSSEHLI